MASTSATAATVRENCQRFGFTSTPACIAIHLDTDDNILKNIFPRKGSGFGIQQLLMKQSKEQKERHEAPLDIRSLIGDIFE